MPNIIREKIDKIKAAKKIVDAVRTHGDVMCTPKGWYNDETMRRYYCLTTECLSCPFRGFLEGGTFGQCRSLAYKKALALLKSSGIEVFGVPPLLNRFINKFGELVSDNKEDILVHCDSRGIIVGGANKIGSTSDTVDSSRTEFIRVAKTWWDTYISKSRQRPNPKTTEMEGENNDSY